MLKAAGFRGGTDFRLRDDSPLIDRGVLVPGVNDNFGGSAPDIGYWEKGYAVHRVDFW